MTSVCISSSADHSRIQLNSEVIWVPGPIEKMGTEDKIGCCEHAGISRLLLRIASRAKYCKDASVCYGSWQFPKNDVEIWKGVEFDRPGFHH